MNVRARDSAGNADPSPASVNWTIDVHAPTVAIQFPGLSAYTDAASIQIRGTAADSNVIASVTVNGVAAATNDGFLHWTAAVPVATGDNSYVVATSDAVGNPNSTAATVNVANRGAVLGNLVSMALDKAHNRLLVADNLRGELLTVHIEDGRVELFSGPKRGAGPLSLSPHGLTVDPAHNRLLAYDTDAQLLKAFDLDTGDRTDLGPAATANFQATGDMDYDAAHDIAYVADAPSGSVVAIDLPTDTRRIVTRGSAGMGPALLYPTSVLLDPSSAGGTLLVADTSPTTNLGGDDSRIFKVDIATGNRTLLSTGGTPAVGSGPSMYAIGAMAVDAAHNRLLVAVYALNQSVRLMAVDLTTGNRTLVAAADPTTASAQLAYDGASGTAFFGLGDRARILRLDPVTQQLVRFSDSLVGSGQAASGISGMDMDPGNGAPTLVAATGFSQLGVAGGAVRIDPHTGMRTLLTGHGRGSGPDIVYSQDPQLDTRPGAPPNQFLFYDPGEDPSELFTVDATTGNRTIVSTPGLHISSSWTMSLDAANSRMLAAARTSFADDYSLTGIDVATAAQTIISGPTRGTGPTFQPFYGIISAIRVDSWPGFPTRYLMSSTDGLLIAVDPATGNRSQIFPPGPAPFGILDFRLTAHDTALAIAAVGGVPNVLEQINLLTGDVTTVSGDDATNLTSRGSGPALINSTMPLDLDTQAGIAYAAIGDGVTAIDLSNGQRAIVSR